jgi:hypothetical protein
VNGSSGAVPSPLVLAAMLAGAALIIAGVWVLWRSRRPGEYGDSARPTGGPSQMTRTVAGLVLIGLGYHAIAYANPSQPLLQVPISRWWLLPLWAALMLGGSLLVDSREQGPEP